MLVAPEFSERGGPVESVGESTLPQIIRREQRSGRLRREERFLFKKGERIASSALIRKRGPERNGRVETDDGRKIRLEKGKESPPGSHCTLIRGRGNDIHFVVDHLREGKSNRHRDVGGYSHCQHDGVRNRPEILER